MRLRAEQAAAAPPPLLTHPPPPQTHTQSHTLHAPLYSSPPPPTALAPARPALHAAVAGVNYRMRYTEYSCGSAAGAARARVLGCEAWRRAPHRFPGMIQAHNQQVHLWLGEHPVDEPRQEGELRTTPHIASCSMMMHPKGLRQRGEGRRVSEQREPEGKGHGSATVRAQAPAPGKPTHSAPHTGAPHTGFCGKMDKGGTQPVSGGPGLRQRRRTMVPCSAPPLCPSLGGRITRQPWHDSGCPGVGCGVWRSGAHPDTTPRCVQR
jgi:hypothetical protein